MFIQFTGLSHISTGLETTYFAQQLDSPTLFLNIFDLMSLTQSIFLRQPKSHNTYALKVLFINNTEL